MLKTCRSFLLAVGSLPPKMTNLLDTAHVECAARRVGPDLFNCTGCDHDSVTERKSIRFGDKCSQEK